MRYLLYTSAITAFLGAFGRTSASDALPLAEDVKLAALRANGRDVVQALQALQSPLPTATLSALKALMRADPKDPDIQAAKVQELLDRHCLIAVTINPESRVKAARGPAGVELSLDRETVVLVKVYNEAGVTQPLNVTGPQIAAGGDADAGCWLEAAIHRDRPMRKRLSGDRVEYVILRLKPRQAGKREATLRFDVGQGSQDLGFRAEVPVLFQVRPAKH
jgi:hypothetical protein